MFLKALEMQGFKSFPDKTVFKFNKGVTSVVGPNGSGKSNIADAVRWVLGEQSSKNLRGSKMEDVVFSGTKIRKPLGYAEVSLRLENADRSLNCDADEVKVTRRYYRSGESEYAINGSAVRLKDVNELFMDTGLGRDGYSLVSQGRVADLISSKSGQRRDMLEEAAGISHYRYRRTDASRKLAQAEENMIRLRDILSELEGRVGPLKTQSEKAQKFLVLSKDKKNLEIGLWLHTIDLSKDKLRNQENKLSIANNQYSSIENEIINIDDEIEDLISQSKSLTSQIDDVRQNSIDYEEKAAAVEAKIAIEKNTIEHNIQTIERLKKDMADAATTEQSLGSQISEGINCIEKLNLQINEKQDELNKAVSVIMGYKEENNSYTKEISDISEKISELGELISEKRIEKSTFSSSVDEISARMSNIDGVLTSRKGYVEELEKKVNADIQELEAIKTEENEIKNTINGYEIKVKNRKEKEQKIKEELDTLNLNIQQKSGRIHILEDMEKNMEGYLGSVKAVVRHAKNGALNGIHGPLSQLISVKPEYAVAIETALGASVQNIVTDNENDAKKAIEFLKREKIGRATFLPLTAIKAKPFTEKNLDSSYGFVDMADMLLEYDGKYSEIIKMLLGRIAVAEDLDSAVTMAKKYSYRFKIVTLDGQVINAGGSMTGGSRAQNSGILSRVNEIDRLNEGLKHITAQMSERQGEYNSVKEQLNSATALLEASLDELKRTQENRIRKESELELVSGKLDTANAALEELRQEKIKSAKRINELNEDKQKADEEITELNTSMLDCRKALELASKNRESIEIKKEKLGETEAAINLEILSLQKDIEARNEALELLKSRMASHEGKLDDLNGEISAITEANNNIANNIEQLNGDVIALRDSSISAKDDVKELIEKRTQCETKSETLRINERIKNAEKEKISGELARLEERKSTVEKQLEDIINKLFDEYQLTKHEAEEIDINIEDYQKANRDLQEIKAKIRGLGNVNVGAIEEYEEVSQRYEFMKCQIEDIEQSEKELEKLIKELTGKMAEQFREQFIKINTFFGETFVELFGGGKAELILENQQDILECNIEIKVQPPGKNVQNIDLLSGGEKGLSAIALLFAILKVSPAPFCIFDEVEAALDDVNVTKYAKYVRRMTKSTQFILITHRRGTMEEADVLYGITMQEEGVSKLLELKTAEMAKKLGIA